MTASIFWIISLFAAMTGLALLGSLSLELLRKPRLLLGLFFLMRLGALILLAFFILGLWSSEWKVRESPRSIVLLEDKSASMQMVSPETEKEFRNMRAQVLEQMKNHPAFYHDQFAGSLFQRDQSELEQSRGTTALGNAILSLHRRHPGANVLLLSDGASNFGIHPYAAAKLVQSGGTRLHVLLPGSYERFSSRDVALANPSYEFNQKTGQMTFRVHIMNSDSENTSPDSLGRVSLLIDHVLCRTETIPLNQAEQDLTMTISQKNKEFAVGWHEYEFQIQPTPEDLILFNNTVKGIFKLEQDSHVMILVDKSTADVQALIPVLKQRYHSYEILYRSQFQEEPPAERMAALEKTSLLILSDIAPSVWTDKELDLLASLLQRQKLTMLFLTPACLKEWLTVPKVGALLPFHSIRGTTPFDQPVFFDHTRDKSDPSEDTLAFPFRGVSLVDLNPGANVLLYSRGSKRSPQSAIPLAVSNEDGSVGVMLFSGSWRWRLNQNRLVASAFSLFWKDLLNASDRYGQRDLALTIQKLKDVAAKDLFQVTVMDYDQGRTLERVKLERIESHGGTSRELLALPRKTAHSFASQVQMTSPGIHWFQAVGQKKGQPETVTSNRVPVLIHEKGMELVSSVNSAKVLKTIADRTNGRVISPEQIRGELKKLAEEKYPATYSRSVSDTADGRRKSLILAALALLLMSLEWLFRKLEMIRNV